MQTLFVLVLLVSTVAATITQSYGCSCVLITANGTACNTQIVANSTATYGFTTCNRYRLSNGKQVAASITSDCTALNVWEGELCAGTPMTTFNTQTPTCAVNPFAAVKSYLSVSCPKTAPQTFDNSKHCEIHYDVYTQSKCAGAPLEGQNISSNIRGACDVTRVPGPKPIVESTKIANDCSSITTYNSSDCTGKVVQVLKNGCMDIPQGTAKSVKTNIAPRTPRAYGCNCVGVDYTESATCQTGTKNLRITDGNAGFGTCETATDGTKKNAWSISEDCSQLKIWEDKLSCDGAPSKTVDITTKEECQNNRDPTIGGSFTFICEKTPVQTYDKGQMCKLTSLEFDKNNTKCSGDPKKTAISYVVVNSCLKTELTYKNTTTGKWITIKNSIRVDPSCTKGHYYGDSTDCGVTGNKTSVPVYQKGTGDTNCFSNEYGAPGQEQIYLEPATPSGPSTPSPPDSDAAASLSVVVGMMVVFVASMIF